jgi:hypothetical protein
MMPKRPARLLANRCLVAQAIAHHVILARQITFRNKIPTAGVLRRLVLSQTREASLAAAIVQTVRGARRFRRGAIEAPVR